MSSIRLTTIKPVMRDENVSMSALAPRTAVRADETPVRRETTTKMFKGTRNKEESYTHVSNAINRKTNVY